MDSAGGPTGWLAALAELVWPLACGGCEAPGLRWCSECAALLDRPATPTWPSPVPPGLPPTWTVASYDGAVRRAIVTWKDEDRHDLARPLAAALARSVVAALTAGATGAVDEAAPGQRVWLVPMPSRPAARRERGGDPVRDLAVRAAAQVRRAGWPVQVLPALRHTRSVADQAGLDASGRAANVQGAFGVRRGLRLELATAPCLLVDDVVTTGATLAEAAAVVRRAGGHPFGAAVVAATRRTRRVVPGQPPDSGRGRVTRATGRV